MAHLFVSHSHEDKARFVDGFVEKLQTESVDVWYDTAELLAGDSLPRRALSEGVGQCDSFIPVLSPSALASRWVNKEIDIALVRSINGLCRIIPVVLDGVDVPPSLSDLVYVRVGDTDCYDSEFARVMRAVREPIRLGSLAAAGASAPRHRPARMPVGAPRRFVNRERELQLLNDVLDESESSHGPLVAVLTGMPGVGKSALAAHWSDSASERFAGGRLYVDFAPLRRGRSRDLRSALTDLLTGLGVPHDEIPSTPGSLKAEFRRLSAEKRLLLVADNVSNAAQITHALPAGRGSMVVATANDYLADLVVDHQAEVLELDTLDRPDSVRMLQELAGTRRRRDSYEDWDELGEVCGDLPVALAVTGARLGRHRSWSVRDLIEDVSAADDPLTVLAGAGGRSLKRTLDASYRSFNRRLKRFYRRIGMFPGRTIEPAAAAVTAGVSHGEAKRMMRRLHDAHLLTEVAPDRYRVHQMIVRHMKSRFDREESAAESRRLPERVVEWYCGAVRRADHAVAAERLRLAADRRVRSKVQVPAMASPAAAYDWYMAERFNVQDVMRLANDMGQCDRVWAMAESLWLLFSARRLFSDWQECLELGVVAAEACGHRDAGARFRSQLARLYAEQGDHERARIEMSHAMRLIEGTGTPMLAASLLEFRGTCEFLAGRNGEAVGSFRTAREQMGELGSARGVAIVDLQLSRVFMETADFPRALEAARSCRAVFEQVNDGVNAAKAAFEAARASVEVLPDGEALAVVERSMAALDRQGLAYHGAQARELASTVLVRMGRHTEAAEHRRAAYRRYRQLGHTRAEALETGLLDADG